MNKTIAIVVVATVAIAGVSMAAYQSSKSDEGIFDYFSASEENTDYDDSDSEDKTLDEVDDETKEAEETVTDQSIWEEDEDYSPPDVFAFDGRYSGIWAMSGGVSAAQVNIHVDNGSFHDQTIVTGVVSEPAAGIYGESVTTIIFSGVIFPDGGIQGLLSGTGTMSGTRVGSTAELSGPITGWIKGDVMTLDILMTSTTYIPDYGPIVNTQPALITLKKEKY